MKITWNKRTNLPTMEFEDSDFNNALHVKQMIEGRLKCEKCGAETENFAWKVLEGYFSTMRLRIEERGKAHARESGTRDLCSNDFSVLDGFDVAVGIPQSLVLQADAMRAKDQITQEEVEYARE